MPSFENQKSSQVPSGLTKVDWSNVRPIYKKLSDDFETLTCAFNLELSKRSLNHLDHLLACIDLVDQVVDDLPGERDRTQLCKDILDFLHGRQDQILNDHAPPELRKALINIRQIVGELGILTRFAGAVETIFDNTERKRHTPNISNFINMIATEGRATAELPLSILGKEASQGFATFFTEICELMGFADLLVDARSDYRNGLIVIYPSFSLHVKLTVMIIRGGIKLLTHIPHKWAFIKYCLGFGYSLLVED